METMPPFRLIPATTDDSTLLISSAHSGAYYPPDFLASTQLNAHQIRLSEDMFVADLFADTTHHGATILCATYPRAYLDLNRAANELEAELFEDPCADMIDPKSHRAAAGLGTVPRLVAENMPIYKDKLKFAEAQARLDKIYHPFHAALAGQLVAMQKPSGFAVLLDAHSMPSQAVRQHVSKARNPQIDFVLGNRRGQSCAPALSAWVQNYLRDKGYCVEMNHPYAGGYITEHYGRPASGFHALQIEINRSIYMDEAEYRKNSDFSLLQENMTALVKNLVSALPQLASNLTDTTELAAE